MCSSDLKLTEADLVKPQLISLHRDYGLQIHTMWRALEELMPNGVTLTKFLLATCLMDNNGIRRSRELVAHYVNKKLVGRTADVLGVIRELTSQAQIFKSDLWKEISSKTKAVEFVAASMLYDQALKENKPYLLALMKQYAKREEDTGQRADRMNMLREIRAMASAPWDLFKQTFRLIAGNMAEKRYKVKLSKKLADAVGM